MSPSKSTPKAKSKKSPAQTAGAKAKPEVKKNPPAKSSDKARVVKAEVVENGDDHNIDEGMPEDISSDLGVATKSKVTAPSRERGIAPADPISIYLASIRKYPLLTKEEEHKLAVKYYESKDPSAAQALVTANLRFVVKIAAEYSKFGSKLIDLIQEGNVGLMHAVREFNPYKGVRLITYAVWWIRGYIQEYLMRQYSLVRVGTTQNQRKLFYKLQKEKETLDALGEAPSLAVLSEKYGIPKEEIEDMQNRLAGRDVSLDRPIDDEGRTSLMDLQKQTTDRTLDEDLALREQLEILKEKVEEIRSSLSPRELIILDERLLADEPLTLQEIGEKYGITREAVRQMEVRVLKKIKTHFLESSGQKID